VSGEIGVNILCAECCRQGAAKKHETDAAGNGAGQWQTSDWAAVASRLRRWVQRKGYSPAKGFSRAFLSRDAVLSGSPFSLFSAFDTVAALEPLITWVAEKPADFAEKVCRKVLQFWIFPSRDAVGADHW
jgi:hypothetical protein